MLLSMRLSYLLRHAFSVFKGKKTCWMRGQFAHLWRAAVIRIWSSFGLHPSLEWWIEAGGCVNYCRVLRRDCPLSVLEWSILGSEFHDGPRALSKQEEPASDFVSSSQWDNPESVVRLGTLSTALGVCWGLHSDCSRSHVSPLLDKHSWLSFSCQNRCQTWFVELT
jgi:hypothetical protein